MKAFLMALVLLVGISVIAKIALDNVDMSSATVNTNSTSNVRL